MLGSSIEGPDGAGHLARLRIDRGHLLVPAIGGEHASGLVVHRDQIRVLANRDLRDSGESLQIEDDDGPRDRDCSD